MPRRRPASQLLHSPGALERYIRGSIMPRYMERLREIEDRLLEHRLRLERHYGELARGCAGDAELFERRWREVAREWRFGGLNELIRQHNEYYAIERDLPVDARTGEYLTIGGRPYEREEVGPDWILARFPAALPEEAAPPEGSDRARK